MLVSMSFQELSAEVGKLGGPLRKNCNIANLLQAIKIATLK